MAYSMESIDQWGCTKCGYAHCPPEPIRGVGVNLLKCDSCGEQIIALLGGLTKSPLSFGVDETGKPKYEELQEHPRKGIPKREKYIPDVRPENGIGEYCIPPSDPDSITYVVKSKEAGKRIVAIFKKIRNEVRTPCQNDEPCFVCGIESVHTDYINWDPHWLKIKIPSCKNHRKNSLVLRDQLAQEGIITEDMIREVLTMSWDFANLWKYETRYLIREYFDISRLDNDLDNIQGLDTMANHYIDLCKIPPMTVFLNNHHMSEVKENLSESDFLNMDPQYTKYLDSFPLTYIMYKKVESALKQGNILEAIDIFKEYMANEGLKKDLEVPKPNDGSEKDSKKDQKDKEPDSYEIKQLKKSFIFLSISADEYKESRSLVKRIEDNK